MFFRHLGVLATALLAACAGGLAAPTPVAQGPGRGPPPAVAAGSGEPLAAPPTATPAASSPPSAAPPADAAAPPAAKPAKPDVASALGTIVEDPPPEKLLDQWHFVISNEKYPERFKAPVENLGGILLGVGTEQNYLYTGWAKPEILLLVDFDQVIVDVHAIYRIFFLNAADADGLIALWSPRQAARARELLAAGISSADDHKRILAAFEYSRFHIFGRLSRLKARLAQVQVATFLSEQSQYDHIVSLLKAGRVRALRGDLTGDATMRGVAAVAQSLSLPLRVIYLSNLEEYFSYRTGLDQNILGLPTDERSIVLRTAYAPGKQEFIYSVQRAQDFKDWLKLVSVTSAKDILRKGRLSYNGDIVHIPGPPPETP